MYDLNTGTPLTSIQKQLSGLSAQDVSKRFQLPKNSELIKTTISVCNHCQCYVSACVFEEDGRVLIRKVCETHGQHQSILENDKNFYRLSNKDKWGKAYSPAYQVSFPVYQSASSKACCDPSTGCCPPNANPVEVKKTWRESFSDQSENKTCTLLVEITNACDLACQVCYADAKGDKIIPINQLKRYLNSLIIQKEELDSVQITGGEAILHSQFWDILDWLYQQKQIKKVYLPTNGIQLSKDETAKKLLPYQDKILVLLQFDGEEVATNQALRQSNPLKTRLALIKKLNKLNISMQLTMTLSYGVSEKEIAWVVAQGKKYKNVRLIAMQPAFYSGRYALRQDPMKRITLSDVAKGVAEAFPQYVTARDFMPIPCSHPNCGWVTLFARRFGLFTNIAKYVDLDSAMDDVANKTLLNEEELRGLIGTKKPSFLKSISTKIAKRLIRPQDVFGIVIKPFMDHYNYDQDRISACCHHTLNNDGKLISFCEYNVRYRALDNWDKFEVINFTKAKESITTAEYVEV
jgi:7,8-dihydro-6-hydroxymethylpterin dimethyltransferase